MLLYMQEFAVTGAQSPAGLFALEILKIQLTPHLDLIFFAARLLKWAPASLVQRNLSSSLGNSLLIIMGLLSWPGQLFCAWLG